MSQILGTAALLEGKSAKGLDQTGLSQKAGPVVSDVRITLPLVAATSHGSNKAGIATADVMLAMDLLVAAQDANLRCLAPRASRVVGSSAATPTGLDVIDPSRQGADQSALLDRLTEASGHTVVTLDASALMTALLGDASTANIAVVGAALQAGCLPLGASSIEEAITLNGVAVAKNIEAFRWGRAWVADRAAVDDAVARAAPPKVAVAHSLSRQLQARIEAIAPAGDLRRLLASRTAELVAFQNERCASDYLDVIERVAAAEAPLSSAGDLTVAVARYLFQLTAYKDEYEVARLLVTPEATAAAEVVGGPGAAVTWKLHPPMLRALGMNSKLSLGPKSRPMLVALARGKRLRNTKLDPFGRAHVRRLERELLRDYRLVVEQLIRAVRSDNVDEAVRIASLPDIVRGYEDRKVKRATEYRAAMADAMSRWS